MKGVDARNVANLEPDDDLKVGIAKAGARYAVLSAIEGTTDDPAAAVEPGSSDTPSLTPCRSCNQQHGFQTPSPQ